MTASLIESRLSLLSLNSTNNNNNNNNNTLERIINNWSINNCSNDKVHASQDGE